MIEVGLYDYARRGFVGFSDNASYKQGLGGVEEMVTVWQSLRRELIPGTGNEKGPRDKCV